MLSLTSRSGSEGIAIMAPKNLVQRGYRWLAITMIGGGDKQRFVLQYSRFRTTSSCTSPSQLGAEDEGKQMQVV